ncbi:MAG: TrpR-related protein YerC/YecD [Parcubacteria group bacterium Gr01-1014_2]|nr:MAG: TrpR-related protein YerC/YecD [Parcubacteria group bacterium Gr01-1014_2]
MKLKPRNVKKEDKIKYLDYLYTAISSFKSREEVKCFLRDLLTESERIMIGRRILIAQRLLEDKSYDQIVEELHVGIDTITRVHRWLEDESDGYERAVKNLKKELFSRKLKSEKPPVEPYSFAWLKKKYPLHFFLFNLIDKIKKD